MFIWAPAVTVIDGAYRVSPRIVVGSASVATAGFPVTRESLRVSWAVDPTTVSHPGNANVEFQALIVPFATVTLSFAQALMICTSVVSVALKNRTVPMSTNRSMCERRSIAVPELATNWTNESVTLRTMSVPPRSTVMLPPW